MADPSNDATVKLAIALLKQYGFDQGELTADQLLDYWLRSYPARWIQMALIQALYQGRYKAVSVEQILRLWLRRGQPTYHFNHEFERLVCHDLPRALAPSRQGLQIDVEPVRKPIHPKPASSETAKRTAPAKSSNRQGATSGSKGSSANSSSDSSSSDLKPQPRFAQKLALEPSAEVKARSQPDNIKGARQGGLISQSSSQQAYVPRPSSATQSAPFPTASSTSWSDHSGSESEFQTEHPPIHQFQPHAQDSTFSDKLLAIAKVWKQTPETEKMLPPLSEP
jgi:hypothetical protein